MKCTQPGLFLQLQEMRVIPTNRVLMRHVQVQLRDGEVLLVSGPSGAGKSSFLSWIGACLDPSLAACGQLVLDGEPLEHQPLARRRMGWVFQDPLLFPHLSVGGNLALALRGLRGQPLNAQSQRERIAQALTAVGLEGMEKRDPASLSGGQRARVALLRSLLSEPRVLLLDEPFAALDGERRAQLRHWLFDEMKRRHMIGILVSHDPQDAPAGAQQLVLSEDTTLDA